MAPGAARREFEFADCFDPTAGLLRQSLLVGFPNFPLAFNLTGVPLTQTGTLFLPGLGQGSSAMPGFDFGSDTF